MQRSRKQIVAVVLAMGVAGCASENWVPGPDARGTMEEATARCDLMARHSGGGFYAQGSERFVAGAAAGYAAGRLLRAYLDYNDCMKANGWLPVKDRNEQTAYVAPVSVASPNPQNDAPAPPARCTQDELATADLAKKQGYNFQLACTP